MSFDREAGLRALLAQKVLGWLDDDQEAEVRALGSAGASEHEELETTVSALHLAFLAGEHEPLPEALRHRISNQARTAFEQARESGADRS